MNKATSAVQSPVLMMTIDSLNNSFSVLEEVGKLKEDVWAGRDVPFE